MATRQIPDLPLLIAMNGTEEIECVQSGTSYRTTSQMIANLYAGGGGGGGTGTVTSIATSGGLTGGTITTSGTISIATGGVTNAMLADVATLTVKGRSTAGTGAPTDLSMSTLSTMLGLVASATTNALDASNISSGNLPAARLTTNLSAALDTITGGTAAQGDVMYRGASGWSSLAAGTSGYVLSTNGPGADPSWIAAGGGGGSGTVTSVALSGGTTGLSVSGSPITTSGTITLSGTLVAANGGTGQSSYAIGDILYASTTSALSKLAGVATGNALISGGVTTAPSWGKIGLTTHVSGTLPVANGGTGVTTSTGSGSVVLSTSPTLVTPVLGTPSSGTLTSCTGLPLTTGVTGTLPVANGGTGTTTSTGSGNVVLSTSPTLVTPALGTPSALVLTNATGLSAALDTLVATAAQGDILYRNATAWTRLAAGTNGYVLQSGGAGANPSWVANSGGGGTVTSIDVSGGTTGLTTTGGPITGSGTITLTGTLAVANGGTGRATGTTAYALVATGTTATGAQQTLANGATTEILVGGGVSALPVWTTATGSGAPVRATSPTLVTPALGTPSSGTLTSCTGLPLTTGVTGILPVANGGTNNAFFTVSGPATSAKTYTFPNATCTVLTSNTAVTVAQGGTGQTTYAIGDILQASASTTLSKLAAVATGNVLISGGVTTVSSWGKVGLTTHVSGTLPVANGGTGVTSSTGTGNVVLSASPTLSGTAVVANMTATGFAAMAIDTLTDGATITPDFSTGNNFSVTLGGNRTFANPTSPTAGQSGVIYLTQDATGSRTVSWGSQYKFPGGTAPTLSTAAGAVDAIAYCVRTTTSVTCNALISVA